MTPSHGIKIISDLEKGDKVAWANYGTNLHFKNIYSR